VKADAAEGEGSKADAAKAAKKAGRKGAKTGGKEV